MLTIATMALIGQIRATYKPIPGKESRMTMIGLEQLFGWGMDSG